MSIALRITDLITKHRLPAIWGMAGTMMACPAGMEQEQRFLQSLQKVESYRIKGSHLEMLDAAGAVVARFEAVALR